uniref:MEIOB-like N-terminal domain-containing protein n=3 Tax=Dendroctonus ponderosae TaxID=77166 RepID=A0AAR5PFV8_DENPD
MNQNQTNAGGSALKRVELKDLDPNMSNVLIVGIIIAKQRPKVFESQRSEPSAPRAVWNFTLRDSLQHYINVCYWGPSELIFNTNEKFSSGAVVQILNPNITIRKLDDRSEQYHPMVTSPYKLSLTEKSAIIPHVQTEFFLNLLNYPTKPTAVFVPIHDIHNRGGSIQFADVLGAIRGLSQIRSIHTRLNEVIQAREVEVFDHTSHCLRVTLWEPDLIERSNNWKARTTVIFLTDLRIEWSNYAHSYVAKSTGRTIVTESPRSKEAQMLLDYAQTAPIATFDIVEQLVTSMPASSAIDEIMSVRQIQDRINSCIINRESGNKSFTVTLFAFISELDLDGLTRTLMIKCGRCKMIIRGLKCENAGCLLVFESTHVEPDVTFDITVGLSDHTGTLPRCKLSGHTAELALGCLARDFSIKTDEEKCVLKWKYLLEQCKLRIAIIFAISQSPIISILHIEKCNPMEVARKLPVY